MNGEGVRACGQRGRGRSCQACDSSGAERLVWRRTPPPEASGNTPDDRQCTLTRLAGEDAVDLILGDP